MTKSIIFTILFCLLPTFAYSANVYVFGINGKDLKKAKWHHVFFGAISGIIVHELGHLVALEASDVEYSAATGFPKYGFTISGPSDEISDNTGKNIARAGFATQHAVNIGLITWKEKSDFTYGYRIITTLQTLSYPLRHNEGEGDFAMIDKHGGNGNIEHEIFSSLTLHNIFRIEW